MLIQQLAAAVQNKRLRQEELHGKQYLVVPMAMLTVGVHHGSNGPLFYPLEELAKTPAAWNMKPVVVYHPQGTTATAPDVARRGDDRLVVTAGYRHVGAKNGHLKPRDVRAGPTIRRAVSARREQQKMGRIQEPLNLVG